MEKMHHHQHQWCRAVRSQLSYKNATAIVCILNIITALLLFHSFFFSSTKGSAMYRHIRESEDIRRSMVPLELIKRVREIGEEVHVETESNQQKDMKQTAAGDVISRLNNFRSYSDVGNMKALEEWRKRKMERARQRSSGKNITTTFQS